MNVLKKLLCKKSKTEIPTKPTEARPRPSLEAVAEMMYDQYLDAFSDEVVSVIYSKDKTMRYVILKSDRGYYSYQLEGIYQYDEYEWQFISSNDKCLPALWEPLEGKLGSSFFGSIEELMPEIENEPEYKQYFI